MSITELNLLAVTDALDEVEFFERERTNRFYVELAIVLYNSGLALAQRRTLIRGDLEVDRPLRRAADRGGPSQMLLDETVVRQRGEEFVLYTALVPETREVVNLGVYPAKSYLTTRLFLRRSSSCTGRCPEPSLPMGHASTEPHFRRLRIRHVVLPHGIRNRVERWFQELKRRIDAFYASFSGKDVTTTNQWLRQFSRLWNTCLC